MEKTFVAVAEDRPGAFWQRAFSAAWPRVRPWYLREGLDARPTVGEARAALARNYDFDVACTTGCILSSCWLGRRVIAMSEAAWGCLDGMNENGLVVSLTFGGRPAHGRGFGMPLILR